jgi:putative endonuclease
LGKRGGFEMAFNRMQQFGANSESDAARLLKKEGYKILEQNFRTKLGEIDIIARDRQTIVFVEVKARTSDRYGKAKWAVTPTKQKKLSIVALSYLKATRQQSAKARFDVVAVDTRGDATEVEIIKNAFELAYK